MQVGKWVDDIMREEILNKLYANVISPRMGRIVWNQEVLETILNACIDSLESDFDLSHEDIVELGLDKEFLICYIKGTFTRNHLRNFEDDFTPIERISVLSMIQKQTVDNNREEM